MKKRIQIALAFAVSVALLAAGCAPKVVEKIVEQTVMVERAVGSMGEAPAAMPAQPMPDEKGGFAGTAADVANATDRMIIQTVNMSVVVEDTDKTLAMVNELITQYKGYIADSRRWMQGDQAYASVTLRVPAESLNAVLGALRGGAIRVDEENLSGQDVTEEYVDVEARLRNLEATEKELLALMTEVRENRGKAEDILAIYRELTNIRQQIESYKGRMQYLERMTALATISLQISPKAAPRPLVERAKWSPLVTISNAARGLVRFLQVLVDLLVYVLIFSPIILVPALVIWLIARAIRRRKQRKG